MSKIDQEKFFESEIENCSPSREIVVAFVELPEEKKAEERRLNGRKIFSAFLHIYDCVGFGDRKVYAPCTELWHQVKSSPSATVQEIARKVISASAAP